MKKAIGCYAVSCSLLLLSLSGCGISNSAVDGHLPSPVIDQGMTLDWGKDVKSTALRMIQHSHEYVDLDMYELSDEQILQALIQAKKRGVSVRVVLDATESHSTTVGTPTLEHSGVPTHILSIPRGISHIKMLIVDHQVLMGGMNYGSQSWLNNDASVWMPTAPPVYQSLFQWDWVRSGGQGAEAPLSTHSLIFDAGIEPALLAAIQSAKTAIDIEAFDLSSRDVIAALIAAANRGVSIEILLDTSEYGNRSAANQLRDAGVTVRFYLPYGQELMHAKILDVDHGNTFIIGSANFSHQAYTYNHEGDIILHNVPLFDQALMQNLAIETSRGTDYPLKKSFGNPQ
jgi:cardiolipin synthase A/B